MTVTGEKKRLFVLLPTTPLDSNKTKISQNRSIRISGKPYGKQSESLQKTLMDTIQIVQTLRSFLPPPHIPVSSWKSENAATVAVSGGVPQVGVGIVPPSTPTPPLTPQQVSQLPTPPPLQKVLEIVNI